MTSTTKQEREQKNENYAKPLHLLPLFDFLIRNLRECYHCILGNNARLEEPTAVKIFDDLFLLCIQKNSSASGGQCSSQWTYWQQHDCLNNEHLRIIFEAHSKSLPTTYLSNDTTNHLSSRQEDKWFVVSLLNSFPR